MLDTFGADIFKSSKTPIFRYLALLFIIYFIKLNKIN
jgi:hypothetical protein